MKVLIVDDDFTSLAMLAHALKRSGHEVTTAPSAEAALPILAGHEYRLVICDWEMPGMSGPDLCRIVRAGDFGGYVYFILLTSRESSEDIVDGLGAGADDFMKKPCNHAELLARIRTGERIVSLETRDLAIFAMAKLAESRDPETGKHLERVRNYSQILANDLARQPQFAGQIDAAYAKLIYLTSPLHDIGKVAIPDCVLLKPGRLSDREFQIMKSHAALGAQTLDAALREHPAASFLQMAREIAATHHERFDGTGYPNGLRGNDIPLCGRIVAVADVYDALTSKRIYKAAISHDVARSIIEQDRGTHFDSEIIASFLRNEAKFVDIQTRYAETFAEAA